MPLRLSPIPTVLSLTLALAACKDKPAPPGTTVLPDPPLSTPSATAVAPPAPSAVAPAPSLPRGPRFVVRHRASKDATFHWVGSGVVVCPNSTCLGDAELITEKGLTDTYDPRGMFTLRHRINFEGNAEVSVGLNYIGVYPDVCAMVLYSGDRTGTGGPTMKRSGKTWVDGDCTRSFNYDEEPAPQRPPRELDDALLHAPIANAAKTMLHGAGAPPMLVAEQALYLWDGKVWSKREAPWKKVEREVDRRKIPLSVRPVRLASGATLLPEGGYIVDAKGEISALDIVQDDKNISTGAQVVGALWTKSFPWLIAAEDKDVFLTTPDAAEKSPFVRATVPERKPAAKKASVEPSPSAAPSASAPPATEGPSSGLTAPKPHTSACTTPFVLLATPPKPGQAYATTRDGLRGNGALQDFVTFVEFVAEGKTYFGVQVRTEADARRFMEVVEKGVKGMKPQLTCLDATSLVPDRYAPPEGVRIVGINLTTGELVPFD